MAYPPHDFKCLYEHACPYLNFMSTRWVFSQYQYGQDEYQEHLKIIDRFQESLKERDEKKKRGAPMGHPGWQRPKPVNIDQTIAVDAPTVCPYCHKQGLTPSPSLHEHIQ